MSYRGLFWVALPYWAGRGETLAYSWAGSQIALLPGAMRGARGAGVVSVVSGVTRIRIDRWTARRAGW
ncbi:hypothetical protein APR08_003771 [Nocardia amikacinitolerans]|nr:hypothetical protein [Nocardia amikacinitolerans]